MEFYFDEMDDGVLVIKADGGLSRATVDQFADQIQSLIRGGMRRIIIDCSGLSYMSSYGISRLLRFHKHMTRMGGDVKLAGVRGLFAQMLAIAHLHSVFDIYPSIAQARLAFRDESERTPAEPRDSSELPIDI